MLTFSLIMYKRRTTFLVRKATELDVERKSPSISSESEVSDNLLLLLSLGYLLLHHPAIILYRPRPTMLTYSRVNYG